MTNSEKSDKLFEIACKYIPGGVNSPVRAFGSVGGKPKFISFGCGAEVFDIDGNRYTDYVMSWGPLILGHAHPEIVRALQDAVKNGTSFGAPTELEVEFAEMIVGGVKSVDKVRLVNSGTEAAMTAVRLARGYTNRPLVLKFDGCYHGHSDCFLTRAGSGLMTSGIPASPGVPEAITQSTISVPYNDIDAVKTAFDRYGDRIACIIVEPIAANMGVIPPSDTFLEGLRNIADQYESVLIFDEVITGFRIAFGGAQQYFNVDADLTCFGKIIGGGLPVGAVGGKAAIMDHLAPSGDVYQAGTLSGNPLAVTAGLTTLNILRESDIYTQLERAGKVLEDAMRENIRETGIPAVVQRAGSMLTMFFNANPVKNFVDAGKCDNKLYSKYFHAMLKRGIYLAPSPYEAMFLSTAHNDELISRTAEAQREALPNL